MAVKKSDCDEGRTKLSDEERIILSEGLIRLMNSVRELRATLFSCLNFYRISLFRFQRFYIKVNFSAAKSSKRRDFQRNLSRMLYTTPQIKIYKIFIKNTHNL